MPNQYCSVPLDSTAGAFATSPVVWETKIEINIVMLSQPCLSSATVCRVVTSGLFSLYYRNIMFMCTCGYIMEMEQWRVRMPSHPELFRKAAGALLHPRTSQSWFMNGAESERRRYHRRALLAAPEITRLPYAISSLHYGSFSHLRVCELACPCHSFFPSPSSLTLISILFLSFFLPPNSFWLIMSSIAEYRLRWSIWMQTNWSINHLQEICSSSDVLLRILCNFKYN